MCTDRYIVLGCKCDTFTHRKRVTGMKTAGEICHIYIGHDMFIQPHRIDTKSFAHVTV